MFRRGGALSASLRHGSPRGMRGETTKPEPRKWSAGPPSHPSRRLPRPALRRGRVPSTLFDLGADPGALPAGEVPTWRCLTSCGGCSDAGLDARDAAPTATAGATDRAVVPRAPQRHRHTARDRRPAASEAAATGSGQRAAHRRRAPNTGRARPSREPSRRTQSRPATPTQVKAAPAPQARRPATAAPRHAPAQPSAPVPIAQLKRAAAATQRPVAPTKPAPAAPAPACVRHARLHPPLSPAGAAAGQRQPHRPRSSRCIGGCSPQAACQPGSAARPQRMRFERPRCAPLVLVDHAHAGPPAARARHRRGPARALRTAGLAHRSRTSPRRSRSTCERCGTSRCTARATAPATTSPSRSPSAAAASG